MTVMARPMVRMEKKYSKRVLTGKIEGQIFVDLEKAGKISIKTWRNN